MKQNTPEHLSSPTRPATPRGHPAPYNSALLPIFVAMLLPARPLLILDPFAGSGRIHQLRALLPGVIAIGVELEPEWARLAAPTAVATALRLPFPTNAFDAIVTSPTYGNRMADHHHARDAGPRHTYRHALGRPLHAENSGAMQWGDAYRAFHVAAWTEARRVLKPGGILVLNVKDHIRRGARQEVTAWHVQALRGLGFAEITRVAVPCPGQRHGANGRLRVDYEWVIRFVRAAG